MKKFIGPRGSGRTYQICQYAIEHDCDIIVPTDRARQMITSVLFRICEATDIWTYRDYNFDTNTVRIDRGDKSVEIRIFTARDFTVSYFGYRTKPIVIDDIDESMQILVGDAPVAAVSMSTYDPADVALQPGVYPADTSEPGRPKPSKAQAVPLFRCRSLL